MRTLSVMVYPGQEMIHALSSPHTVYTACPQVTEQQTIIKQKTGVNMELGNRGSFTFFHSTSECKCGEVTQKRL